MSRKTGIAVAVIGGCIWIGGLAACASTPEADNAEAKPQAAKVEKAEKQSVAKKTEKKAEESEVAAVDEVTEDEVEITAEMVVDFTFADPKQQRQFCKAYRFLGPEAGFIAFKTGYDAEVVGGPSVREVFEEAASRC